VANDFFCTNCGYVGKACVITKGSFAVELLLWLFFLLPGLIYSFWRLSSRFKGCPSCKKDNLIPANSPKAQALLNK
jgi:uncharacterized membrane protein YqaE (UPF0057 family)